MQMLCKVASAFSDVRCPVCGQDFMVYWTRLQTRQRGELRESLLEGLRLQHGTDTTADAHASAFYLAEGPVSALAEGPVSALVDEPAALMMPALLGVYS